VPRHELIVLSMSVEEAIKMVISGGIVTPPDRRLSHATSEDEEIALPRLGDQPERK
jgi:uncharacterized membrane protein